MATRELTSEKALAECLPPTEAAQAYYWCSDLRGFGVVVGKTGAMTFVVRTRVNGTLVKRKIGIVGRPNADGHLWTVKLARIEAKKLIGQMTGGKDPLAAQRAVRAAGPTLRDAFDDHLARLEKAVKGGKRSQSTIDTFEKSKLYLEDADGKYAGNLLDRPIAEVDGVLLGKLHEAIKRNARGRSTAKNEKGAPLANRVIVNVGTAWMSLNKTLGGKLGNWNPAKSVDRDSLVPARAVVTDLADWYRRVQTMRNPIQRDGLEFALFTGLRNEDVRTVRFEFFDEDARTLRLPDPKGGEKKAFTIPLPARCIEILKRRRTSNRRELGGVADGGWAFPALDREGEVGAIGDLRQQLHEGKKHSRFPAEDVHTLRRTFLSVAQEVGISEIDQRVLSNHSFASGDVHEIYIAQHIDHLRSCSDRIAAALEAKLNPKPTTTTKAKKPKRDRHLRAV